MNENTTRTLQRIFEISYDSFNKQTVLKARLEGKNDFIDVLQKKCTTLEQEKIIQHEHFEKLEATAKEVTYSTKNYFINNQFNNKNPSFSIFRVMLLLNYLLKIFKCFHQCLVNLVEGFVSM